MGHVTLTLIGDLTLLLLHNTTQVLSSYKKEGFDFLVKVFNSSDHLEQLTGLTHLYNAADQADVSGMQMCMPARGGRVCGDECVRCAM